jgi:hypothetical protein
MYFLLKSYFQQEILLCKSDAVLESAMTEGYCSWYGTAEDPSTGSHKATFDKSSSALPRSIRMSVQSGNGNDAASRVATTI